MPDRLPPLTALRAFDAAARHMSFAKAAEELNVTPAALSFQIKSLEEHLGQPLFRRMNRAVDLTEAGRLLAPGAQRGFETLTNAWRATKQFQDDTILNVTAGPAFTAKWLAPRLYDFARAHPGIELRLSAAIRIMDFLRDGIDVAIRFGYGVDEGLFSQPMAEEWFTPVMTPDLAQRYTTPESLHGAPLIIDEAVNFLQPSCDWAAWFAAAEAPFSPASGTRFSQSDHAVDAALAGVGVALGRRALVVKDIHEGRLIAPFNVALTTKAKFRILCPKGHESRPQILALRNWIVSEVAKTASVTDGLTLVPADTLVR
jgi:LysR family glycine cleavage system transcriptional activator